MLLAMNTNGVMQVSGFRIMLLFQCTGKKPLGLSNNLWMRKHFINTQTEAGQINR